MGRNQKRNRHRNPRPSHKARQRTALKIVATDSTFKPMKGGHRGKCFYCRSPFFVSLSGETLATVEHIRPRARGGTNDLENLTLACKSCNSEKGMNADLYQDDSYFVMLQVLRMKNWRALPSDDGVD